MEEQPGPSLCFQSANQSSPEPELQDRGVVSLWSFYCQEDLMWEGEELSYEELRAERCKQQSLKEMEEKTRRLREQQEQLSLELEWKRRLLERMKAEQVSDSERPPAAAPFKVFDESQCGSEEPAGAAVPADLEPPDDVFLRPDETGLCLRVQLPARPAESRQQNQHPDPLVVSFISPSGVTASLFVDPTSGQLGRSKEDPHTGQRAVCKPADKLSPIQETSVEAGSLGELSAGNSSPLDQNQEVLQPSPSAAADSPHPDVRRRLLERLGLTSCEELKPEQRPLPAVEQDGLLELEGDVFHIESRCLDGGSFSVFKANAETGGVLMKVDRCCVPWDLYVFTRLKEIPPCVDRMPLIDCFLFLDGCITVYTPPPHHQVTDLGACGRDELTVGSDAVRLLELVLQLHSCQLLHAGLQPAVLAACCSGLSECLFPVDWSSALDLSLQMDVTSVRQLPSAQPYVGLGLLQPSDPPHSVDLVGVAETVHFLLTGSKMIPVKDGGSWTVEQYAGDKPCDIHTCAWRRFFRSLLNAAGRSSVCVLSELRDELSSLYL